MTLVGVSGVMSEISQQLLAEMSCNVERTSMFPSGLIHW